MLEGAYTAVNSFLMGLYDDQWPYINDYPSRVIWSLRECTSGVLNHVKCHLFMSMFVGLVFDKLYPALLQE